MFFCLLLSLTLGLPLQSVQYSFLFSHLLPGSSTIYIQYICTIFRARIVAKTIFQAWYLDFFLQGDSRHVVYIVDLDGIEYSFIFFAPGQFFSVSYLTDERSHHLKFCCYIVYILLFFLEKNHENHE